MSYVIYHRCGIAFAIAQNLSCALLACASVPLQHRSATFLVPSWLVSQTRFALSGTGLHYSEEPLDSTLKVWSLNYDLLIKLCFDALRNNGLIVLFCKL